MEYEYELIYNIYSFQNGSYHFEQYGMYWNASKCS